MTANALTPIEADDLVKAKPLQDNFEYLNGRINTTATNLNVYLESQISTLEENIETEINTGLNNKLDKDGTNAVTGIFENIINLAQSTGKTTIVGWGMPDYTAGISVSAGSFTPTTNGYWVGNVTDRSDSGLSLKVGTITIFDSFYTQYDGSHPWCFPLAKGVTYTIGGSGWVRSYFYPCIGEV